MNVNDDLEKIKNNKNESNDWSLTIIKFINILVISTFIFTIILKASKLESIYYFAAVIIIWILLFINFDFNKSNESFQYIIIITIGSFLGYLLKDINKIKIILENKIHTICCILIIILLLGLYVYSYIINIKNNKNKDNKDNFKLIQSRQKDLIGIIGYLEQLNIIGINAPWGMGKSYLIEELKNKIKHDYEIIEIDILTCNLDDLLPILIKEIEKIMLKNRIISKYSRGLKKFISNNKKLGEFIDFNSQFNYSYSETIKGFREELQKLDRKILIIYEDIDRVSDANIIKRIFALSEKLSSKNVKIIYQYDEERLNDIDECFTYDYLEKYITHKVNLTEISFLEVIEFIVNEDTELELKSIKSDDFKFLINGYRKNSNGNSDYIIGDEKFLELRPGKISIRKIKNFLIESELVISELKFDDIDDYKSTVIGLLYLKHFKPEIYGELSMNESPIETFKLEYEEKLYTLYELLKLYINDENKFNKNEILKLQKNIIPYNVLILLGYKITAKYIIDKKIEHSRFYLKCETPNSISEILYNEKVDAIIRNILARGKSKNTYYEELIADLIEYVLDKPKSNWNTDYRIFKEGIDINFYGVENISNLNEEEQFITLASLFSNNSEYCKYQVDFAEFYQISKGRNKVDETLIRIMNNFDKLMIEDYRNVKKLFNKLDVDKIYCDEKHIRDFIKKYIMNIIVYKDKLYFYSFDLNPQDIFDMTLDTNVIYDAIEVAHKALGNNKEDIVNELKELIYNIEKIILDKEDNDYTRKLEDIEDTIKFIHKVISIIDNHNEREIII